VANDLLLGLSVQNLATIVVVNKSLEGGEGVSSSLFSIFFNPKTFNKHHIDLHKPLTYPKTSKKRVKKQIK